MQQKIIIDGLVQDHGISTTYTLSIPKSCTKLSSGEVKKVLNYKANIIPADDLVIQKARGLRY